MALGFSDSSEPSTRLDKLDDRVSDLSERISRMEVAPPTLRVPITSFTPEPYSLVRPIEVLIEPVDDSYVASFFDANISASGDNQQEAFDNLKALILDVYDSLHAESPSRLGPEPKRQLAVLDSFLEKA